MRPRHTCFVNVGRGATLDEGAVLAALRDGGIAGLLTALRDGGIAGAVHDVFVEEPLPADSPLWEAPSLIITARAASGPPLGAEPLIEENLRRYLAGEPLVNVTTG